MTDPARALVPRVRPGIARWTKIASTAICFVLGTGCTQLDKEHLHTGGPLTDWGTGAGCCAPLDKSPLDARGGVADLLDGATHSGGEIAETGTIGTGGDMGVGGIPMAGDGGTGGSANADAGGTDGPNQAGGGVDTGSGKSVVSAGCALIMHLDETSWNGTPGEVIDACAHNHGTAVKGSDYDAGLPHTTAAGYFAGAGDFESTDGCIQVPDDSSLRATTQLTLAAWIFPTALDPASNGIIAKRTDYMLNSSYTMFLWSEDSVTYQLWADVGSDRFRGKVAFETDRWYHVAVVFDEDLAVNQRVRLYVNGGLDGEFAEVATAVPTFGSPLYVGCLPLSGPAQVFSGKIDEAVVWTRALGPEEIGGLYTATGPL